MKNKNIFMMSFLGKKNTQLNSRLLFISLAIGTSIGYQLFKKYASKRFNKSGENIFEKSLNNMCTDHKNSTAHLIGNSKYRNDTTKINVPEAGTLNWRKSSKKSMFPPIPDPNIRIN